MTEPATTREHIRAVITAYLGTDHDTTAYVEQATLAALIDKALFELPEDQERALEEWAAGEVAERDRTRTELARARESLREKNEIIKAYAGPTGMTPEDVAFALAGG